MSTSALTTGTLWLLPNRERSLVRRHPWVFSGAIDRVTGAPVPGDTVLVCTAQGTALGLAAYSPASQIRARMWNFDAEQHVTAAFVASRIVAAARRREHLLAGDTDSARLVFSEADGVPGLIADRYGDTVVCQLTTAGAEAWRDVIADALGALPGIARVYERSDAEVREREALAPNVGVLRGDAPAPELLTHERGLQFAVDVASGHKTGFYLDQRDGRAAVAQWAARRNVLNVFSYTGAFSVIAAKSGATSIMSIDSSGPALATANRNAQLNSVDIGEVLEADAFTALRGLRDRARQFDLILLDPPKLANNAKQVEKATRAYKDLNLLAIKLLAPGGVLMTWSCSGAVTPDLFQKVVAGAALDAAKFGSSTARIIGRLSQPSDHPVPLAFPEAEYLKGLIIQSD